MHWVCYVRVGSFTHRNGRGKNLQRVVIEGIPFYWEGNLQRYQSDVLADPGKLMGHPSVDLAAMGIPPEPQGTGPDLWVGGGDTGSGIPRKRKGKVSPPPEDSSSQVGG